MHYETIQKSLIDIIMDANSGVLNPDPIGQRPPVSSGFGKAQGIIDSLVKGFSIGAITVRDIRNDEKNQKIYPGVDWLVLDGGNRIRAIRDFQRGRFATADGKIYRQFSEQEKNQFENQMVTFTVYNCTDIEGTEIFRRLNTNTPVNQMEMIMANDTSSIAEAIRRTVKSYKEYDYNEIHPIFEVVTKPDGKMKPVHWSIDVNPRRKWDEYVGIAYIKAFSKGNVDAGLDAIETMVETDQPPLTSAIQDTVTQMLDDSLAMSKAIGKKLNTHVFAAFQAVWFGLYEKNKVFRITDYQEFGKEFYKTHTLLTGKTAHKYDSEVRVFPTGKRGGLKTKEEIVRKYLRSAIENFANPAEQHQAATMYLENMNIENCVLFRDERRTISKDKKFEMLAAQDFRCAIDGEPLDISEAIFGHDTAWAQGGQIEEGAIIRKSHNQNMGTTTLEEYRLILKIRKEKANA